LLQVSSFHVMCCEQVFNFYESDMDDGKTTVSLPSIRSQLTSVY